MYAIIRAGGKQHKVAKGDVIEVELLKGSDTLQFVPLLVVDDKGKAHSDKSKLSDARVTAKVVGETKGPKVEVQKFRNKSGYRRNTGHRQRYTAVEISEIKLTAGRTKKSGDSEGAAANSEAVQERATDTAPAKRTARGAKAKAGTSGETDDGT